MSQNPLPFTPTEDMIQATKHLIVAMAYASSIKDVVDGYKKEILQRHQFTNKGEIATMEKHGLQQGRTMVEVKVILDPFFDFDMCDEDFAIYIKECNAARDAAGLSVERDDSCPYLVAEMLQIQAERVFVDALEPITGLSADRALNVSLKSYKKLVDIGLRLMTPLCGSSEAILNDYK